MPIIFLVLQLVRCNTLDIYIKSKTLEFSTVRSATPFIFILFRQNTEAPYLLFPDNYLLRILDSCIQYILIQVILGNDYCTM